MASAGYRVWIPEDDQWRMIPGRKATPVTNTKIQFGLFGSFRHPETLELVAGVRSYVAEWNEGEESWIGEMTEFKLLPLPPGATEGN